MVLSFSRAKNPMDFESADQNGWEAPSVSGRICSPSERSERTHSFRSLEASKMTAASLLPSGETAMPPAKAAPSGGGSRTWTTPSWEDARPDPLNAKKTMVPATASIASAEAPHSRSRLRRAPEAGIGPASAIHPSCSDTS